VSVKKRLKIQQFFYLVFEEMRSILKQNLQLQKSW